MRDFNKVGGASKSLAGDVGKTTKGLEGLASKAGFSSQALKAGLVSGAAAAGTALVAFGVKAVGAYQESTQAVLGFQRASGASAETSSLLVAAFDDMGISAETGSKAVFQLGKRLETGAAGLAKFGIEAVKDSKGNTDLAGTLLNVADAYQSTADPAERAALLAAAFGKQGQELIPILEKGRAGIESMFEGAEKTGQVFSQADLQRSEDFRLAIDELSDSVKELSLDAGGLLVPALTDVAGLLAKLAGLASDATKATGGLLDKVRGAADFHILGVNLKTIFDQVTDVIPLKRLGGTIADIARDAEGASGPVDTFSSMLRGATQSSREGATELDAMRSALLSTSSAQRGYNESLLRVSGANERVVASQEELNELLAKGAVDAQKVTQATRSLAAAQQGARDAGQTLADAQRDLDDILARGPVNAEDLERATRDLADAQRDLEGAHRGVASAQEKVIEAEQELADLTSGRAAASAAAGAEDDLTQAQFAQRRATLRLSASIERQNEVKADATSSSDDLADAQLDVEESQFALKEASEGVMAAQKALTEAQNLGKVGSEELKGAQDNLATANEGLKDANQHVADTTQAITDKEKALREAAAGDPGFAKDLEGARRAVEGANRGVAEQTQNVIDREAELREAEKGDPGFADTIATARRNLRDAEREVAGAKFAVSEQAYALQLAQEKENEAMEAGEGAARRLKDELTALVRAHPELAAFLGPSLARLADAVFLQTTRPGAAAATGNIMNQARGGGGDFGLTSFHGGGYVPAGVTMPAMLHGPEAVIPLGGGSGGGGGGNSYAITVNAIDPKSAAESVIAAIAQWEARNGSRWRAN